MSRYSSQSDFGSSLLLIRHAIDMWFRIFWLPSQTRTCWSWELWNERRRKTNAHSRAGWKTEVKMCPDACRHVLPYTLLGFLKYFFEALKAFLDRLLVFPPITHFSVLPLCSQEGLFSHDVRTIILQRHPPSGIRFYDCNLTPFLCPISDRAVTHFKGRRHQITVHP